MRKNMGEFWDKCYPKGCRFPMSRQQIINARIHALESTWWTDDERRQLQRELDEAKARPVELNDEEPSLGKEYEKGITNRDYRNILCLHYFETIYEQTPIRLQVLLRKGGWTSICWAEFKLQTSIYNFKKKYKLRMMLVQLSKKEAK